MIFVASDAVPARAPIPIVLHQEICDIMEDTDNFQQRTPGHLIADGAQQCLFAQLGR